MQAETTEKLLSSNSYLLMLLNETLDLQELSFLNTKDSFCVEANESKTVNLEIEIDCPFGDGSFFVNLSVNISVIKAKFQGNWDHPSDPDEVDVDYDVESISFFDSEGQEYIIDISAYNVKRLISKLENYISCS